MTDNEFLLHDRITKIKSVIEQYKEENFYISFSGGKDSTVLSALVDIAIPENKIPRVFADTGIEFNLIRQFVYSRRERDNRVVIIKPSVPIKTMLETEGYPFKSKSHSSRVDIYQRLGMTQGTENYLGTEKKSKDVNIYCPKKLRYQFTEDFHLRISDKCCDRLKKDPIHKWEKENSRPFRILGLRREEEGRRESAKCLAFRNEKLYAFQPLVVVSEDWMDWFIKEYSVELCELYYPPYNFTRTGCKGCPFNIQLQDELNTLEKYFPGEYKQCEAIWKPVYDEYRRIGYRLKDKSKMTFKYKTKPWKHQEQALQYLFDRDTAALYTDMGTGKTKIMIDLIQNRGFRRVLVVAPNKACEVWEEQIHIHGFNSKITSLRLNQFSVVKCTQELEKLLSGTENSLKTRSTVIIINYEKVWREGLNKIFLSKELGLDCVICDESHRIKTPRSKCSMYLAKLGKRVQYRYLVTGTPLAENPTDVYAQYKFLDPTIFGTNLSIFRNEYEVLDPEMTARIGHRILDKDHPYKNLEQLHEKMFSCAFYVTSSVKLPEQTDIEQKFIMPQKTEKLYKQMFKEKVAELNGMWLESDNVLTTILRLQQITSGYASVEDIDTKERHIINVDKARPAALRDLLEDLPKNESVVIFARFKKDLKNIHRVCKHLNIKSSELSGSVDTLKEWKQGKTQVLAIQYSSGSESIDLTRARYCIYYSMTPRLALYEQSRKRVHRPGQTRPVVYYHLIETMSKGITIDEKMYRALQNKQDIVKYVMEKGWE